MRRKLMAVIMVGCMGIMTACSQGSSINADVTAVREAAGSGRYGAEEETTDGEDGASAEGIEGNDTPQNEASVQDSSSSEIGAEGAEHSVSEMQVPIYYSSAENKETIDLVFIDGVKDIPYVSLDTWKDVLIKVHRDGMSDDKRKDPDYDIALSTDGDRAVYERDNQFTLAFDFENDFLEFVDFDGFFKLPDQEELINLASYDNRAEDGEYRYYKKQSGYDRYGKEVRIDLADYDIDLIRAGGGYYAPLQTIGDITLHRDENIFYNGETVILIAESFIDQETGDFTDLGDIYFSAPTGERSKELAEFSYNELCLVLDSFYGLKEVHGIEHFDDIFVETGLKWRLLDSDPAVADEALFNFIDLHLDDLHSGFKEASYMAGEDIEWDHEPHGVAVSKIKNAISRYNGARQEYYPDGCPGYEEVGNTAYITFDHFVMADDEKADYYKDAVPSPDSEDTIGILAYAYNQITREDSPVENVVMDLSLNTGGEATAAVYAIGMFLGTSSVTFEDTLSGARVMNNYSIDTNLDGKFNDEDTLSDKGYRFFCLTSPISFSCGNLVPSVFKYSDEVTMLGKTSGGGSCVVQPLSTAWGTGFQISGYLRLAFNKNGSFYDIDQGTAPDYVISHPGDFYDRKALTEFINNIY